MDWFDFPYYWRLVLASNRKFPKGENLQFDWDDALYDI